VREFGQILLAQVAAAVEIIAPGLIAGGQVSLVVTDIAGQAARDRPNAARVERFQQRPMRH